MLNEADTRVKLVDPKLLEAGCDEVRIQREYRFIKGRIFLGLGGAPLCLKFAGPKLDLSKVKMRPRLPTIVDLKTRKKVEQKLWQEITKTD